MADQIRCAVPAIDVKCVIDPVLGNHYECVFAAQSFDVISTTSSLKSHIEENDCCTRAAVITPVYAARTTIALVLKSLRIQASSRLRGVAQVCVCVTAGNAIRACSAGGACSAGSAGPASNAGPASMRT